MTTPAAVLLCTTAASTAVTPMHLSSVFDQYDVCEERLCRDLSLDIYAVFLCFGTAVVVSA